MTSKHDPYACPICLAIGKAAYHFPPVIRVVFGTIGIFTFAIMSGHPLAILTGAIVGVMAAELVGAATIHAIRIWLRRRVARFNDPAWRDAVSRYVEEIRARRRW